jgi:outer membrane protein OmpA-like peptidoglycan-associated protein
MKKYITLSLILLLTVSYGQNKATEKADKLFESYQYMGAIDEYLKLADSKNANQYIYTQLAESYYNVFNATEASKWYAKATKEKSAAEIYYHYAETLKIQGKYQEANKQMDMFASLSPNDSRAKEHKANPNYIPSLANKSKMFDIAETNINSEGQSDFGAVLTNDNTLYFVSTRNTSKKTDQWVNQPYLDIFKATRNESGTFSEPTSVSELNTPYHDGPVAISADGNTIYFARDGHSEGQYEKSKATKTKIGQQGLYKAVKKDGKWTQIEPLPFNSKSYSVTHPSLSKDGKTLYFSSNMPNGLGESDIWKVAVEESGFGKPQNLGANVNTPGKENFPFITDDNTLYFASSGRQGFGGLDVFKTNVTTNEPAQNVGKPVNSEKDDFSLSYNTKANVGYFASNRSGVDAVYSAVPVCTAQAIAVVTDKKTGVIITNANVSILDTKGNVIETKQTDSQGKVGYDIECQTAYTFNVKAENYETESFPIQKTASGPVTVTAQLSPTEIVITDTEVILKNVYFDFDKSNITAQGSEELDKLVKVMKENPTMNIFVKAHTDSKGSNNYNQKLSERRAQSTVQYLLSKGVTKNRVSGKGFGSTEPKVKCTSCSEEEHAQNRRSEFVIVKK